METKYSFKRKYRLKAQSPMIHFQHEQWGSTLRATEVKSKFDRFLLAKLADVPNVSDWFIGSKKKPAFMYKMRIFAKGGRRIDFPPKIFYSELTVDVAKKTRMVFCDAGVEIICLIPELMEAIDRYIGEFFLCHNFGRMTSKGFGSFTVEGKENAPQDIKKALCSHMGAKACYAISGYTAEKQNEPFDDIAKLYGVMKSGHNIRDYHHSYLFTYAHEVMGISNEKAAMKAAKISPWDENGPVRNPGKEDFYKPGETQPYFALRPLLGVGEHIAYLSGFEWGTNRFGVECWRPIRGEDVSVKIENETIERLSSPIFFKIVDGVIYMVAGRINPIIFGQVFTFTNTKTGASIELSVPDSFDIDDFLDWFVTRYNVDGMQPGASGRRVSYGIGKEIVKLEGGSGE